MNPRSAGAEVSVKAVRATWHLPDFAYICLIGRAYPRYRTSSIVAFGPTLRYAPRVRRTQSLIMRNTRCKRTESTSAAQRPWNHFDSEARTWDLRGDPHLWLKPGIALVNGPPTDRAPVF